jgi:apolipoprotein N-acyltransferase
MTPAPPPPAPAIPEQTARRGLAVLSALVAVASFHLAYADARLAPLMILFLACTAAIGWIGAPRPAFWLGLGVGMAVYAPHLWFFARIFGPFAVSLWLILSVWIGFFTLFVHFATRRLPRLGVCIALPLLWTGLEYFRSELYPLRFTWLTPGLAFPPSGALSTFGVYGVGFLLMTLAAAALLLPCWWRLVGCAGAVAAVLLAEPVIRNSPFTSRGEPGRYGPLIVGIQAESPYPDAVPGLLDRALAAYPDGDLFMLSEYTFSTPPPADVQDWCRRHQKYLLVGGVRKLQPEPNAYRDTAFVIGPTGDLLFEQAKSVPIQFMQDGQPAQSQALWDSPWGPIGICVCYDLSYTRVTDRLVRMGANMLLVPTMDVAAWGLREHELHARIGPARASEYQIPVVRVCSSGISQIVDRTGHITASAPFPGRREILAGKVRLGGNHLPLDRTIAPVCSTLAIAYGLVELTLATRRRIRDRRPRTALDTPHPAR